MTPFIVKLWSQRPSMFYVQHGLSADHFKAKYPKTPAAKFVFLYSEDIQAPAAVLGNENNEGGFWKVCSCGLKTHNFHCFFGILKVPSPTSLYLF